MDRRLSLPVFGRAPKPYVVGLSATGGVGTVSVTV